MLAYSTRPIQRTSASRAVLVWMLTCMTVFYIVDGIATRNVPVYVENFRVPGMSDEQVLSLAVQSAYEREGNYWWIHPKTPYLVFEPSRDYEVNPQLYEVFDLEMITDGTRQPIGLLKPRMASLR